MADSERLASAFKALSNPRRLQIFTEVIRRQNGANAAEVGSCGCLLTDFIQRLGIGAPTVSHHLRALEVAGLIELQRDGRNLRCMVSDAAPLELIAMLAD